MKNKLKEFFDTEMFYVKVGLEKEHRLQQRSEIVWNAMQRGLGAVTLIQFFGVSYEEAERMYAEYKQQLHDECMKDEEEEEENE